MGKLLGNKLTYKGPGKGDKPRESTKESRQRYRDEYERIYGKRKKKVIGKE